MSSLYALVRGNRDRLETTRKTLDAMNRHNRQCDEDRIKMVAIIDDHEKRLLRMED